MPWHQQGWGVDVPCTLGSVNQLHVLGARTVHLGRRGTVHLLRALRPDAALRPPWERTVMDDIAARRPWNLRVKWARQRALRRVPALVPGVTVAVVSWNSKHVTRDVIDAVRALSPPDTRLLVVDNGSTDGTAQMLDSESGIETMILRSNAGHGVALDLAVLTAQTSVTVTLDSDALPLREGWLEPVVEPVQAGHAVLAGLRASRNFVHPVFSAVHTASFIRRNLSYQAFVPPGVDGSSARWGLNAWDTAELMTGRLREGEVTFVDATANAVPGLPGMTAGGVVYHHGGISRASDHGMTDQALEGWRSARDRLREAQDLGLAPQSAASP